MAIAMGKHVYCEKPLTRTIWEARRLTEAARKAGVVTQMGNHRHSLNNIKMLREWLEAGAIGDKGAIVTGSYANACRMIPETEMQKFKKKGLPPETYPRSVGHFKEWIDACKGGPAPGSNFDYAGALTEVVLLGVLAVRAGKKIECDPKTGKILNLPGDHPYIRPKFRRL